MNSFAIVKLGPSQQKVSVGDVVITDLLKHEVGTKFTVSEVYMTSEDGKYTIGTPTVGTVVEFEVLDHEKGKK